MRWRLITHELRLLRRSAIGAAVVLYLFMGMLLGKADAFVGNDAMNELIATLPSGLLEAFGIVPASFQSFEGFFSTQAYLYYVLMLGCFLGVWSIAGIAKERERGTAEFLFTLPYSRTEIYLSKAAAHWIAGTALYASTAALCLLLGEAVTGIARPGSVLLLMTGGYMICLLFAGIGYALSGYVRSERSAMAIGIGIVGISFLLTLLGGAGEVLGKLANISPIRLFDASEVVQGSGLTVLGTIVTLGVYGSGIALGLITLKRRDLT